MPNCQICNATFGRKQDLNRHFQTTHLKTAEFTCPVCDKTYYRKDILLRHLETHQEYSQAENKTGESYHCSQCPKTFSCKGNAQRHEKLHKMPANIDQLHSNVHPPKPLPTVLQDDEPAGFNCLFNQPSTSAAADTVVACPVSHDTSTNYFGNPIPLTDQPLAAPMVNNDDNQHLWYPTDKVPSMGYSDDPLLQDSNLGIGISQKWEPEIRAPLYSSQETDFPILPDPQLFNADLIGPWDEEAEELFRSFWHLIRTHARRKGLDQVHNFRLPPAHGTYTLQALLDRVHAEQRGIYKLNVAFGVILRHKTTGSLKYWYEEKNTAIFNPPLWITNTTDFTNAKQWIADYCPYNYANQIRPDTQYELYAVTNVAFYVNSNQLVPTGNEHEGIEDQEVAAFIRNSRSIYSFNRDTHRRYSDNLCFFRCVAGHRLKKRIVTRTEVETEFNKWAAWCAMRREPIGEQFPGVDIVKDISHMEDCYNLNIFIYTLTTELTDDDIELDEDSDGTQNSEPVVRGVAAQLLVRSMKLYPDTIYLNHNFNHFSLITNIQRYAKYWRCQMCGRVVQRRNNYMRHLKTCTGTISRVYPGGGYGNKLSIFEQLQDEGIDVPLVNDRFYPFRIVFDFECRFEAGNESRDQKLIYEQKLIPVSVSVLSNIPGATQPHCFIDRDPKKLVQQFYNHLLCISETAHQLLLQNFQPVTDAVMSQVEVLNALKMRRQELRKARQENEVELERLDGLISEKELWDSLLQKWQRWLKQVPVIGFNSAKFDLNLIRRHLIPCMVNSGVTVNPIMRGSSYLLISTDTLQFMDVTSFLAAGTSYSKWLAGFGVEEKKGIFPYEWLTDFDLLQQPRLPPKDAFFSTLKQKGVTDEKYRELTRVWVRNGFKTMKDLLIWYNNLDVGPFLSALNKMTEIFQEMGIDMLKSNCISLPGLAQLHMFKNLEPDTIFQLFNENNKSYRDLVHKNVVGGPSIIFKRMAVAGVGQIKGTGPTPQIINGFDANGLYSWSLAQNMPTGIGFKWEPDEGGHDIVAMEGEEEHDITVRKLAENMNQRFTKSQTSQGFEELICVNLIFKRIQALRPDTKLTLRHRFNGKQKLFRFGKSRVPVDGWIPELRVIIQYHGCYYHGHDCHLTGSADQRLMNLNAQRTRHIQSLLETTGCDIYEMRQCQFYNEKKENREVARFAKQFQLPGHWRRQITMLQLVKEVQDGNFFGMMEVDIQVPFWNPGLREKMKEFPPIFKNTDITIDDIGETMAEFAKARGLLNKPRRALIGSYHAKKLLMATPLLKWYLDHGLHITRIHSALQYMPKQAFAHLPQEVADQRRRADVDPNLSAYGLLFKLMGNSYYGKCLTDKEKHLNVSYQGRKKSAVAICSPHFRRLDYISDDVYELHMAKARIVFDLPINIAFFVYAYAKLRMLEFYYDFLLQVLPEKSFELLEMDTDSLYFSLASPTLEAAVPDQWKQKFRQLAPRFLVCSEYDKKTPGLFKMEWSGSGMISLCPKTYIAFSQSKNDPPTDIKLSTKGISHQTNKICVDDFKQVLETKRPKAGRNLGFRMYKQSLWKYTQQRFGLTYLYIKRKVLNDGVNTVPLDI